MGEDGTAFALTEYQVPKHGFPSSVKGGTVPKAAKDKGGLFADVNLRAAETPGPEKYHKDIMKKGFVTNTNGGKFSAMGRDLHKKGAKATGPSVGHYEVDKAIDTLKPRARGGKLSQNDRKCYFALQAERNTMPAAGKYDPKRMEPHLNSPVWSSPRTESRSPRKPSAMGPGHYNPSYTVVDKSVLTYSGSKDVAKSFLDKIIATKDKDKNPPPGYVGIPSSKWQDRQGQSLHTARLLLDRPVVPRQASGTSPDASPVRGAGAAILSPRACLN